MGKLKAESLTRYGMILFIVTALLFPMKAHDFSVEISRGPHLAGYCMDNTFLQIGNAARLSNAGIVLMAPDDAMIEVFDITGTKIRSTTSHNFTGLARGIYLVRVNGRALKITLL